MGVFNELKATERNSGNLHTLRISTPLGSGLIDLEREVPVILGWSADSVTVSIVSRERQETLAEQEARYERERKEAEAKVLMKKLADQRLIDQVSETTRGRRDNYGRPLVNFLRIAALWHDYLAGEGKLSPLQFISPEDVAYLMILLKVARAEHSFQTDNMLDILGYTDCLDDMNRQMKEMGYAEGLGALKTMSITELGILGGKLTAK